MTLIELALKKLPGLLGVIENDIQPLMRFITSRQSLSRGHEEYFKKI
jgi:hypothetical protein